MTLTILSIVAIVLVIGVLFINLSPQFGGNISKQQKLIFEKSSNYENGKFQNIEKADVNMTGENFRKMFKEYFFKKHPNTKPENNVSVQKVDSVEIANPIKNKTDLIWFGHSSFLIQMEGKNILLDPVFSDVPAPHPLLGNKRFNEELPIIAEKLPEIDMVIISHDHYDHLDYETIKKIKHKVKKFFVPLGVGSHLEEWKVDKNKIQEFNWWDSVKVDDVTLVCTPAQHFSGRGLFNRNSTLWSSWILKSPSKNIFFSGDSGYGTHFKEIGDKYGPFDFAMLECGQYNKLWKEIHMFPEETAQTAVDLKAEKVIPIHWGAFKLAMHTWTDPIERFIKKSNSLGVEVTTPEIGRTFSLDSMDLPKSNWWEKMK